MIRITNIDWIDLISQFEKSNRNLTVRYFFSDETQLKNAKMAAVLLSKLLYRNYLLPGILIASRTAVWSFRSKNCHFHEKL